MNGCHYHPCRMTNITDWVLQQVLKRNRIIDWGFAALGSSFPRNWGTAVLVVISARFHLEYKLARRSADVRFVIASASRIIHSKMLSSLANRKECGITDALYRIPVQQGHARRVG